MAKVKYKPIRIVISDQALIGQLVAYHQQAGIPGTLGDTGRMVLTLALNQGTPQPAIWNVQTRAFNRVANEVRNALKDAIDKMRADLELSQRAGTAISQEELDAFIEADPMTITPVGGGEDEEEVPEEAQEQAG